MIGFHKKVIIGYYIYVQYEKLRDFTQRKKLLVLANQNALISFK
jgi:hypothetical protein